MKKHLIIFEGSHQVALEDVTNYTTKELKRLIEIQRMFGRWYFLSIPAEKEESKNK
jgi:hypothetical protein